MTVAAPPSPRTTAAGRSQSVPDESAITPPETVVPASPVSVTCATERVASLRAIPFTATTASSPVPTDVTGLCALYAASAAA